VTRTEILPSTKSQSSGAALVSQVLSPLTLQAPSTAPTSVPRPLTATQTTAPIKSPGQNSEGLMIPTCGT
jgi:hypothetical protein